MERSGGEERMADNRPVGRLCMSLRRATDWSIPASTSRGITTRLGLSRRVAIAISAGQTCVTLKELQILTDFWSQTIHHAFANGWLAAAK